MKTIRISERLIKDIASEIIQKEGDHVGDHTWNADAHVEITLSAHECRQILEAAGKFRPHASAA